MASTLVFYAAARMYVLPKLGGWSFRSLMPPILLLHYPGLPAQFAYPAARGDLLAAVLAFASLVAVVRIVAFELTNRWSFWC